MNTSFDFKGKTALVTGGVSGIGGATSLAFRRAGAKVIACGITEAELATAQADPAFAGIDVRRLDVTDDAAVRVLIGGIDRLDFLVNSAGLVRRDEEYVQEVFEYVMDEVNVAVVPVSARTIPIPAMAVTRAAKPDSNFFDMLIFPF